MRKSKTKRESFLADGQRDCGRCKSAAVCWDAQVPADYGFLTRSTLCLRRGSALFSQGESFRGLYVVAYGCLKLREIRADGVERIVTFRVPGEMAGVEGWSRGKYPHTAIAADDATVCELEWPRARSGRNSLVMERLLSKTASQLDHSNQLWIGLPALERVKAFLCDFAARMRVPREKLSEIALPMTRADIGSYLGLAEETVVRALAKLRASRGDYHL